MRATIFAMTKGAPWLTDKAFSDRLTRPALKCGLIERSVWRLNPRLQKQRPPTRTRILQPAAAVYSPLGMAVLVSVWPRKAFGIKKRVASATGTWALKASSKVKLYKYLL
jgi:hypothetical protein